jgi:hypothetical protein
VAGCVVALRDLRDQAEHALLDELDQAFKHLGFARKVAVQRGLTDRQARGQRGGGNAL